MSDNEPTRDATPAEEEARSEAAPAPPPPIDPTKTHQVAEFEHDKPLTTCRIDPTGEFVFAGAEDLHVYRWELATGEKTDSGSTTAGLMSGDPREAGVRVA